MVEGQEQKRLPASAEALLEKRQFHILQSIASLELRLSNTAKLEVASGGHGASVTGDGSLENGDERRVSKESCDGALILALPLPASAEALLEKRQFRILESIASLELRLSNTAESVASGGHGASVTGDVSLENGDERLVSKESCDGETVEQRLSNILRAAGATKFIFRTVPSDYYERTYEKRRDLLGAASVDHLCKSIVMVNTQAHESVKDCSDRKNSKYYVIVVQYIARLNAEKVKAFVHSLNEGKIPKKRFNLRLAPEEESNKLTGFEHNAVTPIGMREDIPVILSDAIVKLSPRFFWLGGGEVDLKLGLQTDDFIRIVKPFITDCIY